MKEFKKYDTDPDKWIKTYKSVNPVTSQVWRRRNRRRRRWGGGREVEDKTFAEITSFPAMAV